MEYMAISRQKAQSQSGAASLLCETGNITLENLRDPHWYASASLRITQLQNDGEITPLNADRLEESLEKKCFKHLGMTIAQASQQKASALERCTDALTLSESDIEALEKIYDHADGLEDDVKKKCLNLLSRTKKLQRQARESPTKAWIYIGRDSEGRIPDERKDRHGAGFFDVQWFHIAFFQAFEHPTLLKRLVIAPPGHGKTTILRWWAATKIAREPWRRICWLSDIEDKAGREVRLLDDILSSPRYKAIYPEVRILDRNENAERSSQRFTVDRVNWTSREPTIEGWGVTGSINGNGYDLLICDDLCDERVRDLPNTRKKILEHFDSVCKQRLRNPDFAEICFICTPWHDEDVAGVTEDRVRRGEETGWLILRKPFAILDDEDGKAIPLWEKYSRTYLENLKVAASYTQTHRLETRREQERALPKLLYYNSERNGEFTTKEDLELMDSIEQGEAWLSIDPAASQASWSSDNGVLDFVLTSQGYAFVREVWLHRLGVIAMENWIIRQIYFAGGVGYTGIQIEAQGAMKGQVSGWEHHITDALKRGMIPSDATDDAEMVQMPPMENMPEILMTDTRMGMQQNLPKFRRFKDAAPYAAKGYVRFAGQRKRNNRTGTIYLRHIPGSDIETFAKLSRDYDGTTRADAIDAFSQWVLTFQDQLINPNMEHPEQVEDQLEPPSMLKAFQKSLAAPKPDEPDLQNEDYVMSKYGNYDERICPWN